MGDAKILVGDDGINSLPCEGQIVDLQGKDFLSMFNEQVAESSQERAVVTQTDSVCYQELDLKSNRLAYHLKGWGIKNGDLVGLCCQTGIPFITGILGILKSGGAYLPLDPNYPKDLLSYMIKHSNPRIILVQEEFKDFYPEWKGSVFHLNELFLDASIRMDSSSHISLDDPAYVVYTSGSTGEPKGIVVSHRSLPNIGISHRAFYPKNTRALVYGGICFDATILTIFHTLLNGGCLYLPNFGPNLSLERLSHFIRKHSVNFMICVPSLYGKILDHSSDLRNLRSVSLTGEMLPTSLCFKHAKLVPTASLYNEYGPTECAIGTTIKKIYDPMEKQVYRISVGLPLVNTRVFILDDHLQICRTGQQGEIYIESIGLAQGYLNNKALTNQSFKEITFDANHKLRLYKTGDLGRYLDNGEIEFLGRVEQQLSINGYKMYLGEIESSIYLHPEVKGAAVSSSRDRLVAYVTTSSGLCVQNSIKKFLGSLLPSYMIPDEIVHLDSFPLSPNGKIDRKALSKNKAHKSWK